MLTSPLSQANIYHSKEQDFRVQHIYGMYLGDIMINTADSKSRSGIRKYKRQVYKETEHALVIQKLSRPLPIIFSLLFLSLPTVNAQTSTELKAGADTTITARPETRSHPTELNSTDGGVNSLNHTENSDQSDKRYFLEVAATGIKASREDRKLGMSAYFNSSGGPIHKSTTGDMSTYFVLEGRTNFYHENDTVDLNVSSGFFFTESKATWYGPHA